MNLAVAESSFLFLSLSFSLSFSLYLSFLSPSLFSLSSKLILLHTSACQILVAVGYLNQRPSTKRIVAAGWSVLSLPFCTTLEVILITDSLYMACQARPCHWSHASVMGRLSRGPVSRVSVCVVEGNKTKYQIVQMIVIESYRYL